MEVYLVPNTTWKQCEREVARRLGGFRVGCTGEAAPDVQTPWCSVEVKTRKRLPKWLLEAMAQAVANAAPGTLPLRGDVLPHLRKPEML